MNFNELRKKHAQFIYKGFLVLHEDGNLKVIFDLLLTPDIKFKPTVVFPNIPKARLDKIGSKVLDNLAFNLGMVELLSYWKAACPPEIVIKAGYLDNEQIRFWKKLLIKGLGEFFYTNKIDFTQKDLVEFNVFYLGGGSEATPRVLKDLKNRDLVLVGGGKDSVVTLESISETGKEFNCLILNPTEAAIKIAEAGGCQNPIIIKRTIDPKLLELNKKGYLNGHTPFSAYLAFLAVFTGVLYDYKNLVVSNEASSDEGNVVWKGQEINHQYSKTSEFEQTFRDYAKTYLAAEANYFSFLRSLGELQIAELFSKMEKYHKIFRSCNKGSKQGIWCGECPKCVSTYLLLYPFLGQKTDEIFKKDITENKNFTTIVNSLLRENNQVKPFECVATVNEIKTSITKNPKVLQMLNQQKVLILGFGREGKTTLNFLEKHKIGKKIEIADQNNGENYLGSLKNYDVIIRSPGIPYLPEIKQAKSEGKIITSATQIFFDNFRGTIIGVTGTKGKSTTSSLIYEVLKKGGVDVYLVGNIGKPALELLDKLNEDSIVVFELSSFQLEDLDKSPHIAVVTNLYPEHLDHHGSFIDYQIAKFNITKYQNKDDYFIYNNTDLALQELAKRSPAKTLPFFNDRQQLLKSIGLDKYNLLGEINRQNMIPAVIIGRLFGIADQFIVKAIKNFKPLPHRLEFVGEFKGIKFYNDSLATIPQATIAALDALGEDVETLIAGGFDRGINYLLLGEVIAKSNIKTLILFQDTGEKIRKAVNKVQSAKCKVQSFNTESMKEAVELAFKHTSPGKICLLSPASSSFNLFKDYEDRGNQFKRYILELTR